MNDMIWRDFGWEYGVGKHFTVQSEAMHRASIRVQQDGDGDRLEELGASYSGSVNPNTFVNNLILGYRTANKANIPLMTLILAPTHRCQMQMLAMIFRPFRCASLSRFHFHILHSSSSFPFTMVFVDNASRLHGVPRSFFIGQASSF